jgi:hypothetical protein
MLFLEPEFARIFERMGNRERHRERNQHYGQDLQRVEHVRSFAG